MSSRKLLLFIVALILVTGFAFVLGPKTPNWVGVSHYSWPWNVPSAVRSSANPPWIVEDIHDYHNLRSRVVDQHPRIDEVHSDDSLLNRSSSLPLAKESVELIPKPKSGGLEDGFDDRMNSSGLVPSFKKREYSNLDSLEAMLGRARAAIREAVNSSQSNDPDYVPLGPTYWSPTSFHRSYLEMEKQLKIYVYEEGEPPLFHNGPCRSIYSSEGNFIHMMEINSHFRTRDPENAHVFFLPFSVVMFVQFLYTRESHDKSPIKKTVVDYINTIARKYPYWNRSLGADHFMLSCHDWGPKTSSYVPYLFRHSIRALCNANTSEGFNPSKDVSLPEINLLTGETKGFIGGPSPSRRPILAFFAGGLHGPIRPSLLKHWENKDEDIQVRQYLPKGISYYDMMKKSKFCICPSGYEVASPRIAEALYTGCVPVLISDHYVPPFSDVLKWKSFSVEIAVRDIPNLKKILVGISLRRYIRMQRKGIKVRRHFEVNFPPKRYDVFHMILHSVWLRRLNFRVGNLTSS